MSDLTSCPTCYTVKLPHCFDVLIVTLEPSTSYDAVFTNHFGKKKIIQVTSEADGSISIAASLFDEGYFTPFNVVTLEFFAKSSGGYSGYDTENEEGCEAVTVCGTFQCFTLEFYDGDAVEAATIKCCEEEEPSSDNGCCTITDVVTLGDLMIVHAAIIESGGVSYIVGIGDFFEGSNGAFVFNISELETTLPNGVDPNTPLSELFGGDTQEFKHYACPTNIFGLDPVAPDLPEPSIILEVIGEECNQCAPIDSTIQIEIQVTYENLIEGELITVHGTHSGGSFTWEVNNPTNEGSDTHFVCVPDGSEITIWATTDTIETEHQIVDSGNCP